VFSGRYDAFTGLVLLGDGNGGFEAVRSLESGFIVPGDGKSMAVLMGADGNARFISTQNRGKLLVHASTVTEKGISFVPPQTVHTLLVEIPGGKTQRIEIYNRSGFNSNSGKSIEIPRNTVSLKGVDYKGNVVDLEFD
jgi:hypothetical protein